MVYWFTATIGGGGWRLGDVSVCVGTFVLSDHVKWKKIRGTGLWEARYGQARMEVADCVGVEPSTALVSPSVSSYLGQPEDHVTDAKETDTHLKTCTILCLDLLCLTSTTRQRNLPDGGMHHTLSVNLIEGPGSGTVRLADWLGCWNTAFITLMHW